MRKVVTIWVSLIITFNPLLSTDFWEKLNNPSWHDLSLSLVKIYNDEYYVSDGSCFYISYDSAKTWKIKIISEINFGPTHSMNVSANGDIYIGTCSNGLWKSSDKGENWEQQASNIVNNCVQSIICKDNGDVYAYSWEYIVKSTDNGLNWRSFKLPYYPESGCRWNTFICTENNIFFIVYDMDDLLKSTDDCQTWEKISIPYDTSEYNFERIATDNSNNVYVVATHEDFSYNKIFKTTDLGVTWIDISYDLIGFNFTYIFTCPNGDLITGTSYKDKDSFWNYELKVYKNNKWYDISYNLLQDVNLYDLTFDKQGRLIFSQVYGFLYRSTESYDNLVDVESKKMNISYFTVFPNPTSSTINLLYRIESSGTANIYLTDVLGNKTLLKSEYKFPGDYDETVDLSGFPQGIYNVVLQTGEYFNSERVVRLK